jgi:gluconolactonase
MRAGLAIILAGSIAAGMASAQPAVIDAEAAFPEGPIVIEGVLHYAQYGAHRVSTWDGTSARTLWESAGCGPSAVAPLGTDLAVTCYDNGTVARIGRDGATIASVSADSSGAALVGPNDLAPDGRGGLYMTASGPWESGPIVGKVYHLSADGTLRMLADDLHYANGIALSPDGTRLFVNESEAGRVISFAVGPEGSLTDRRLFVRVSDVDPGSPGSYPDGLKFGPDGNLWIGQYSAGRIVVVEPDGTFVRAVEVPSAAAPNLAFSADGTRLYVTAVDDTAAAPYRGRVYDLPLN